MVTGVLPLLSCKGVSVIFESSSLIKITFSGNELASINSKRQACRNGFENGGDGKPTDPFEPFVVPTSYSFGNGRPNPKYSGAMAPWLLMFRRA